MMPERVRRDVMVGPARAHALRSILRTAGRQRRPSTFALDVDKDLIVSRQVLNRVVLIEQIRIKRRHHRVAHGTDHPVDHVAVAPDPRGVVGLGSCGVRIGPHVQQCEYEGSFALTARMIAPGEGR